ncbi:hypothetical protein F0160_24290 [Paraburkholderia sp. JPY303]|uniref:winged helix-turn-helix domain-containing protein n=1 Tax=Paraburkholderia atlantica TaxID=2654982 RepID=UPI001591DA44|nr:winged helix-turn-helix domain-containing protein [Paraburkholderia atlantica]NUY33598.1 hypothetical protein [Paraburkholderia atlantica]
MKIGDLEVVRASRVVLRSGVPVKLSDRAYDLLELLIDANGALVSTKTTLTKVWPTTIVEENNIQVHIYALRRMLGQHKHLIQTSFGRGYRLALSVAPDLKNATTHRPGKRSRESNLMGIRTGISP